MGHTEMKLVKALPEKAIRDNEDKLFFFYTRNDGWGPRDHYELLGRKFKKRK